MSDYPGGNTTSGLIIYYPDTVNNRKKYWLLYFGLESYVVIRNNMVILEPTDIHKHVVSNILSNAFAR